MYLLQKDECNAKEITSNCDGYIEQPGKFPDFLKLPTSKSKFFLQSANFNINLLNCQLFIAQIYLTYQLSNPKNLKPANFSDFPNLPTKNLKPANFFSEIRGGVRPPPNCQL